MRAVFDTNIYVSAFAIPGGRAEEAYLNAIHGKFDLVTSVSILTETGSVLQKKFDWSQEKVRELVQAISRVATVVKTVAHLEVLEDEPDNRILECAVHGEADCIVTGDRHLLDLESYQGVRILSLADFLALLPGPG